LGWSQLTLQDRRGGWWIPTSEGLLRFARGPVSSLSTARPESTYTRRQGLRSDGIFRLFEDSRGGIWVATYGADARGLARIDPVTGAARVFGPRDGFQDDLLTHALAEDRFGAVWVGFNEGRLLRYRDKFDEIPLRYPQPGQGPTVPGTVRSILADRQGRVWLASTAHGLGRIDDPRAEVPAIRWYGKADGLSSDTAWMLVEDVTGELFIGTGRGVDRFDPPAIVSRITPPTMECRAERSGEDFAIDRDEYGWRRRTASRDSTRGPKTGVLSQSH
jgi:ligand-binding sensor domain-containing protein